MTAAPPYLSFDPVTRRVRLSPRNPSFVQNPGEAYAFLHKAAPTFFWEDFGFWCLASFDVVNRAFRDRRFGRERPDGYLEHVAKSGDRSHLADFDRVESGSMLELEPPAHTRLRTLVNRAFVSRQIERLRPKIEALAHDLIDRFEHKKTFDLIPGFAMPFPATIIAELMGLPVETGPQLVAWSNDMVRMYAPAPQRDDAESANASARDFAAFIRLNASKRLQNPGDDLLSVLVSARDLGDRLSEDELVSSAILLLNAGHEATVHQIGNAVTTILLCAGDRRNLFSTQAQAVETAEECLRICPPLHMFTRYAYETVEIAPGVSIETGEQVGLLLAAANTDPVVFNDPLAFRPGRPDQKNVSFGAGIHFCIGAPLARLELQIALKILFDRLPNLRLSRQTRFRDTWHFHGLEKLQVEW